MGYGFTLSDIEYAQEAYNELGLSASLAERLEKLKELRDMAEWVTQDYWEISDKFGSTGPHAYRADSMRGWVDELDKAVATVETAVEAMRGVEEAMRGVDAALRVANARPKLN
jgi:hypothetical protein